MKIKLEIEMELYHAHTLNNVICEILGYGEVLDINAKVVENEKQ